MAIPTLIAAVLAWPAALDPGAPLAVQHIAMIPAMRAVMLWHYAFARLSDGKGVPEGRAGAPGLARGTRARLWITA